MGPVFTESQLVVLQSLCDAVFHDNSIDGVELLLPTAAPAWQKEQGPWTRGRGSAGVDRFLAAKFSDLPGALGALEQQYATALSPSNLKDVKTLLSLLSTRAGTLVLTGYSSAFPDLTVEQRERILQRWSTSRFLILRKAYRAFGCMTLFTAYTACDDVVKAIGFPATGDPQRSLDPSRVKPHHPFVFEPRPHPWKVFETDVLVVGSGAGGSVVSSQLAKKGWKTLVVEKGSYFKPEELSGTPREGFKSLYEAGGFLMTEDGGINVLAGATWGGGTTVNWSASLASQHFLRETWARTHGLTHFLTDDYTKSIEFVSSRMGVSAAHIQHNVPNTKLLAGATKLGYHAASIPQNTGGNPHSCGFCGFGCPYSEKQGGTVTWLADAAKAGARFLVETSVERLLFASSPTAPSPTSKTLHLFTPSASRKRCIGAVLRSSDGTLSIVRAREAVVVAAGSIHSPAVLLRSGLKNGRIGKNLRLHPVSFATGYYDEPVNPWEGSIMTAVSSVRENVDGTFHGAKVEVIASFPGGASASAIPWTSSEEHKKKLIQFNSSFTLISLSRDRGSGQIILDANGYPRIDYNLDPYDGLSVLQGVLAGCEIHLAAGASRICTSQVGVEDYVPAKGHNFLADPRWEEWIAKVQKAGIHPSRAGIGSAHQMGSNQMGTNPTSSVVDPRGRVWGTEGLYVADASVFPTASGVNPMITVMSTAFSISGWIDEDLRRAASAPQAAAHL